MSNIRKTFNFREGVQVDDETLVVKGDRVGVGTTSPDESLDVRGNAKVIGIITANNLEISGVSTFTQVSIGSTITFDSTSGVITASSYRGDGSTLSNLPTSQWTDVNTGVGVTPIYVNGNVGVGTTNPENGFQVGGNPSNGVGVGFNTLGGVVASGVITATTFSGNLAGNVTGDLTGTASNATQAASATIATNAQGLTGTPDITVRNINSAGIGTIATLGVTDFTTPTLKGHSTIRSIHGSTLTLTVTVAAKTSAHRYNGQGGSNAFLIDGVQAPFLTLTPGRTYRFDLSDESNKFHGYAEPRFLTVHSEGDSVDFSADGVSYTQYIGTYPDDGITRSDSAAGVSGSFAEVTIPTTEVSGGGLLFYGEHREDNQVYYKSLPSVVAMDTIEVAVSDGYGWSEWSTLNMTTTSANALPTLSNNAANLNLNTWTLLSDVLGVNDTDGDTIQAIRFENTGTDTLSYSISRRGYLDSNVSYDLPSLKDVYVRGHTSFAEETIRVQLYDGYEWGEWTDVTMTSGTNVAPEL